MASNLDLLVKQVHNLYGSVDCILYRIADTAETEGLSEQILQVRVHQNRRIKRRNTHIFKGNLNLD